MIDYQELKRLAEHAEKKKSGSPTHFLSCQRMSAAATPAAVLALIADLQDYQQGAKAEADAADEARAEVRKIKAEVDALRKIISESASACGAAVSVECSVEFMAMLPCEIASVMGKLRKDAERYRWLEKNSKDKAMGISNEYVTDWRRRYSFPLLLSQSAVCSPNTLSEAIDAAMSKESGQ